MGSTTNVTRTRNWEWVRGYTRGCTTTLRSTDIMSHSIIPLQLLGSASVRVLHMRGGQNSVAITDNVGAATDINSRKASVPSTHSRARAPCCEHTPGVEVLDIDILVRSCLALAPKEKALLGRQLLHRDVLDGKPEDDRPDHSKRQLGRTIADFCKGRHINCVVHVCSSDKAAMAGKHFPFTEPKDSTCVERTCTHTHTHGQCAPSSSNQALMLFETYQVSLGQRQLPITFPQKCPTITHGRAPTDGN